MVERVVAPIRVLALDHHTLMRAGLRLLLSQASEPAYPSYTARFEVVGEAGDSAEALRLASQTKPDVILLELNLGGELNTEIIPELIKAAPQARIILLTGVEDRSIQRLAVQMGAIGVVSKKENGQTLYKAIEKVHAGEVWIDRNMMASVLTNLAQARRAGPNPEAERIAALSEREREVIALIGQGMKNKQIAKCMTISETTVRHHLSSIYQKLEVADRLELSIFAYRNGLAELP